MLTLDNLNAFGADTAEGLARCAGMEVLYFKLIRMTPDEANFDKLEKAIAENDLEEAFQASHALKGVLGNLSLTPMFQTCSEMCELLRSKTEMDYTPMLNELLQKREELRALCEET